MGNFLLAFLAMSAVLTGLVWFGIPMSRDDERIGGAEGLAQNWKFILAAGAGAASIDLVARAFR
jgi:hypothetical protein